MKKEAFIKKHAHSTLDEDQVRMELDEVIAEAIADYEAERWHEYPENKPEKHQNYYYVTLRNDKDIWQMGYWDNGFGNRDNDVIAWMEMKVCIPAPFQPQERIEP